MKLRTLEAKDATSMLEWMHDPSVNGWFRADFARMALEDVHLFIRGGAERFRPPLCDLR